MATLTSKLIVQLIDRASAPARGIASAVNRLTAMQTRNSMALARTQAQLVGAAAAGYGLAKAISTPISAAIKLESAMADVNKVTNFSAEGLKQFERDLRNLATSEIPLAVTELTALAAAAAQGGVPETDLLDFTRMVSKSAVAWEVSGAVAGENLAKLRSALKLSNEQLGLFADAINHVSDNTASSAPDLVDFSKRVAAQGEFFGFAKEQALAFGAAMIGAGAESEVAATSFRNMGRALTRGGSAPKRAQEAYAKLGLNSTRVAKTMQTDAVGMTLAVIKRLNALPKHMQASVMSDLFGDEARALAPLLNKIEILEQALGLVSDQTKYAGSVEKEFANRAATTEYALQRFQSRVRELALVVGGALLPPLNEALNILGPMALRIAKAAEKYPGLTRAVVLTAAALIWLKVAAIAAKFGLLWMWGGALAVAKGAMLALAGAVRLVTIALFPFGAAFRAARTAMLGFAASAAILGTGGALRVAAASLIGMLNPMRLVTFALRGLRLAMLAIPGVAVLTALAAAGMWIYNNWSGLVEMFTRFGSAFMAAIKPIMPVLQPAISTVSALYDWVSQLLGPVDGLGDAGERAGRALGEGLVAAFNAGKSAASWIVSAPGKLLDWANSWLEALQAKGEALGPIINGWRDKIVDVFNSIDLAAIGAQIMTTLLNGVKAGAKAVLDFFISLGSKIKSAISGAVSGARISMPSVPAAPAIAGARAAGGPVRRGSTYLVGERGPELWRAPASGRIDNAMATVAALKAQAGVSDGGGSGKTPGNAVTNVGGVTINVQGAPGQSPTQIAEAVERHLSSKLNALSRGAFSDGVY